MSDRLFWHGKHGIGSGDNSVTRDKKGGLLPENFSDSRLAGWLEDGTVSEKPFVSFEEDKQDELKLAKMRVTELEGANAELKQQVKQGGIGDEKVKKDLRIEKSKVASLTAELAEAKKNGVPASELEKSKKAGIDLLTELEKSKKAGLDMLTELDEEQSKVKYLIKMVKKMEKTWTDPEKKDGK